MSSTLFVLLLLTFFCVHTSSPIHMVHGFCFPPEERVTVTYQNRPDLRVPLPPVNVLVGGWDSQCITQDMVGILLEEKMGFPVNWIPSLNRSQDEYWDFIAGIEKQYGEPLYMHAIFKYCNEHSNTLYFEDWTTDSGILDASEHWQDYVQLFGALGSIGKSGWHTPSYVTDAYPELFSWKGLKTAVARDLFNCSRIGTCSMSAKPTLFWSNPGYVDLQLALGLNKNLNLDLYINYTGSDDNLDKIIVEYINRKDPILVFLFHPQWIFQKYEFSRITFPSNPCDCPTSQCFLDQTCDYATDTLAKTGSKQMHDSVSLFARSFTINNEIIEALLADVVLQRRPTYDTACDWLKANPDSWKPWITSVVARTCPKDCVHGNCSGEACICLPGFRGTTCSIPFTENRKSAVEQATAFVLAGAITLIAVFLHIIIWTGRRHPVIMASSRSLITFTVASSFFYAAFLVMFSVNKSDSAWSALPCYVGWIMLAAAFDLGLGSLLVKTYRIARIFEQVVLLHTVTITDRTLTRYMFAMVAYDACVFLAFGLFDYPNTVLVYNNNDQSKEWQCKPTQSTIWGILLVGPKLFALVAGIQLAYQVRSVPSNWNESAHLGYSIYNAFFMSILGLYQQIFMENASFISSACVAIIAIGTLLIVFGPKLMQMYGSAQPDSRRSSASVSTNSQLGLGVGATRSRQSSYAESNSMTLQVGGFIIGTHKTGIVQQQQQQQRVLLCVCEKCGHHNAAAVSDEQLEPLKNVQAKGLLSEKSSLLVSVTGCSTPSAKPASKPAMLTVSPASRPLMDRSGAGDTRKASLSASNQSSRPELVVPMTASDSVQQQQPATPNKDMRVV